MKHTKQYIGIIMSVIICVLLVFAGVYATTTVGNDVTVGNDLIVTGIISATSSISASNFETDNRKNTFVGIGIGTTTTASYNTIMGYQAGYTMDDGAADYNVFIGYRAGYLNYQGNDNIAIGTKALYNGAVGDFGWYNIAIGDQTLYNNTEGITNIAIGGESLINNTTGNYNVAVGSSALYRNTTGGYNVAIGNGAGYGTYLTTAISNNTFIGEEAGYNAEGDSNIFLGYQAGYNETDADKLYIENSNSATPLIYGSFSDDYLVITSKLGIATSVATPSYNLAVDGTASISDTLYVGSSGAAFTSGTASPSADCSAGSLYIRTGTGSVDTSLYICTNTNEWDVLDLTAGTP